MEINWKEERATKNYCGYCTGSPPDATCSGSCFDEKHTKRANEHKVDHVLEMLKIIPKRIEQLQDRERAYKNLLKV
jgi:galactose-1-phosphate uridylyltransferase